MAVGVLPFASAPLSPAGLVNIRIAVGRPQNTYVPKELAFALLQVQTSGNLHRDIQGANASSTAVPLYLRLPSIHHGCNGTQDRWISLVEARTQTMHNIDHVCTPGIAPSKWSATFVPVRRADTVILPTAYSQASAAACHAAQQRIQSHSKCMHTTNSLHQSYCTSKQQNAHF
jgi:hypothetical protein